MQIFVSKFVKFYVLVNMSEIEHKYLILSSQLRKGMQHLAGDFANFGYTALGY